MHAVPVAFGTKVPVQFNPPALPALGAVVVVVPAVAGHAGGPIPGIQTIPVPVPAGGVYAVLPVPAGGVYAGVPVPAGGVYAGVPVPAGGVYAGVPVPAGGVYAGVPVPAGGGSAAIAVGAERFASANATETSESARDRNRFMSTSIHGESLRKDTPAPIYMKKPPRGFPLGAFCEFVERLTPSAR